MPVGLLTDADERFKLGARNGIVTPTAETISDTAVTPFGLTLRSAPARGNVVRVRSVDGIIWMATDKITTYDSDGNADGADTKVDYGED